MIKEIIPLVNGCKKMKNYKLRDDSRYLYQAASAFAQAYSGV